MTRLTLRTIARLLAPWRTIRQLEVENQRLESSLVKSTLQIRQLKRQAVLRARINKLLEKAIKYQNEKLEAAREREAMANPEEHH